MARAITIGNFDGVHVGHQALVTRARELVGASPSGEIIAMAFDPHPASVLRPGHAPARISTFDQRERWLRACGADRVVRLAPTPEFLSMSAREFVQSLVEDFTPSLFVEGPDFHFGRGREGNVGTLEELGKEFGFGCEVVQGVEVALSDQLVVSASSSVVRWLVANGRMRDAAIVLGRPFCIDGVVNRGDRRGRTIGFPTANIRTPCMLPADAVYAGIATLPDGSRFAAGVHVGPRATFGDSLRTVEAHLLGVPVETDADGTRRLAGLPEYGWGVSIEFVSWIRDQIAFGSVDELVKQIEADCQRAAEIVRRDFGVGSDFPKPRQEAAV